MAYTAMGKLARIDYGNGTSTQYDYYDTSGDYDWSAGTDLSYHLKAIDGGAVLRMSYGYDKVGNVKVKSDLDYSTEEFTYDEQDRLAGATSELYEAQSFAYDEIDNMTGNCGRTYLYESGRPHAVTSDGTYSYTYDASGNMASVAAGTTFIVRIDPELLADAGVKAKYRFTGQEKDGSGLYYYGARYYDPELARFVQPDTFIVDSLNRYAYCGNNPLRYTDPTGYGYSSDYDTGGGYGSGEFESSVGNDTTTSTAGPEDGPNGYGDGNYNGEQNSVGGGMDSDGTNPLAEDASSPMPVPDAPDRGPGLHGAFDDFARSMSGPLGILAGVDAIAGGVAIASGGVQAMANGVAAIGAGVATGNPLMVVEGVAATVAGAVVTAGGGVCIGVGVDMITGNGADVTVDVMDTLMGR